MENTFNNDIHRNQVLSLANHGVNYIFLFMSPLFILNRKGFSINKNRFDIPKVYEFKLPILSYHYSMHLIVIPFFLLISIFPFVYYVRKVRPEVVHCRNLISSFLANVVKKLFSLKYKVVCDPRSVYVEECVIEHAFRYQGLNYKVWKNIEKWIYQNSDACIGLSCYFKQYLESYNSNSYYVPAVVGDNYSFSDMKRAEIRAKWNLGEQDMVCCYIGSIGTWHSLEKMISDLKFLINKFKNKQIRIVFLSGNTMACNEITKQFNSEIILKNGRVKPNEVLDYLLMSDIGLVPGSDNNGFCYDLLYDTMISSKAEEYLSSGLPIMVNTRIGSLAKLVLDNKSGYIFDGKKIIEAVSDRNSISMVFNNMFCVSNVVKNYIVIYNSLF